MDFSQHIVNRDKLYHIEKKIYAYVCTLDGKKYVRIRKYTITGEPPRRHHGARLSLDAFAALLRHSDNIITEAASNKLWLPLSKPQDADD